MRQLAFQIAEAKTRSVLLTQIVARTVAYGQPVLAIRAKRRTRLSQFSIRYYAAKIERGERRWSASL